MHERGHPLWRTPLMHALLYFQMVESPSTAACQRWAVPRQLLLQPDLPADMLQRPLLQVMLPL